jgi:hypothetical protein
MVQMQDKPVLFVDIDGVISLWGFPPNRRPAGRFLNVEGLIHYLSADARDHLHDLSAGYELVWCSGWEERANEVLPHALGLSGPLPFLSFDRDVGGGRSSRPHWKLAAIDAYAGAGRALAWIDDAFNDACHAWAAARAAPTLLVPTEPASGMTRRHVDELLAWAA